jgi:hypothetical protein
MKDSAKKRKGGDKKALFFVLILFFLIVVALLLIFLSSIRPIDKKTIKVRFIVGSNPGIDVSNKEVTFGKVPQGSVSTRDILLGNEYNFPVKVRSFVNESIAKYINIEPLFVIGAHDSLHVSVTLSVPSGVPYGNYSGEIIFGIWRK